MKSGMLAAETMWEALRPRSTTRQTLSAFERRFKESWAYAEMRIVAQLPPGLQERLAAPGMINAGLVDDHRRRAASASSTSFTGEPGYERMVKAGYRIRRATPRAKIDNVLTFDKLTDVYNSGTMHEENQPCHLHRRRHEHLPRPLHGRVRQSVPATSVRPRSTSRCSNRVDGAVEGRLQINFTNCVHCKTCDIIDPYQIITWVPPQGGEGPVYTGM